MHTKSMTITEMGDTGIALALLARMNEVDHDGDTYAKGAFNWKGDQWCPLIGAHNRSMMPFGKARIYEEGDLALAELHLNLDTEAGKEWYAALKFDLATGQPVQQYSYGYDVLDAEYMIGRDKRVRRLKQLDVHETSTVIRGAGKGTGTLSMKELKDAGFAPLIASLGELAEALGGDPAALTATGRKQLEQIHAALGQALIVPAQAEAEAKAAIEHEMARHLTRDARLKLGIG